MREETGTNWGVNLSVGCVAVRSARQESERS
jgi:hypothetical protein